MLEVLFNVHIMSFSSSLAELQSDIIEHHEATKRNGEIQCKATSRYA